MHYPRYRLEKPSDKLPRMRTYQGILGLSAILVSGSLVACGEDERNFSDSNGGSGGSTASGGSSFGGSAGSSSAGTSSVGGSWVTVGGSSSAGGSSSGGSSAGGSSSGGSAAGGSSSGGSAGSSGGSCVDGETKVVPCSTSALPEDAIATPGDVTITCESESWPEAFQCSWECRPGTVQSAGRCHKPLFMYSAAAGTANLGGRVGATEHCTTRADTLRATYPWLPKNNQAVISVTSADAISTMHSVYEFDESRLVVSLSGELVGKNWVNLLSAGPLKSLSALGVIPSTTGPGGTVYPTWYSGSVSGGEVDATNTCGGWTLAGAGDGEAAMGSSTETGASAWIASSTRGCNANKNAVVLCIAYE